LPSGISSVTNLGPAFDGSDEEPVEDTLRRAPEVLKTRDRAVTAEDYDNLALAATTDVVAVRCLSPRNKPDGSPWTYAGLIRAPGSVHVIVVPDKGPNEPRPEPSPILIGEVMEFLDRRRDLTASLTVVGPRYLPIKVTTELSIWKQALSAGVDPAQVVADTEHRINAYLHPTRGGPAGTGWQAGQPVFASDVFRAIVPPENVAYIGSLQLSADIPVYHFPPFTADGTTASWDATKERPFALTDKAASVRVADYETVCAAGQHDIKLRPPTD
jgi:predicted phage baseplate assembly protein